MQLFIENAIMKTKSILLAIAVLLCSKAFAYDFSAVCESGQTLCYNITSDVEPYTVEVTSENSSGYIINPTGNLIIPSSVIYEGLSYSVTRIGHHSFYYCSEILSVTIPNSVLTIAASAFNGCVGLTSITIPNSVKIIEYESFYGCTGMTSVTIGNSVTNIGSRAFYNCSGLTLMSIPNSVQIIGYDVFYGTGWYNNQEDGILYLDGWCLGYKGDEPIGNLTIIENTIGIAENAFNNCTGLSSLIFPNSITIICCSAFCGCTSIDTIYSNAQNPPQICDDSFFYVLHNIPVIVPCGSASAYNNAEYWNNFSNIQEDCSGVEENEIADLQIYPNPVSNTLHITSSEQISEIEIVNVMGQVVYRTEVKGCNAVCDVEDLKSGVYVVMISTLSMSKGAVVEQRKFIKE